MPLEIPAIVQPQDSSPSPLYRLGQGLLLGGNALDAASTINNLRNPNFIETNNSIYGAHPSDARVIATKLATTLPLLYLMHKLQPNHDKLAALVGIIGGSFPLTAGIHNLALKPK